MRLDSPIHIHWEVAGRCNLSCVHCYQQADNKRRRPLPEDTLFDIARKLVAGGVFQVTLTGGEPFLITCLRGLVEYFNMNGITPQISSNGTLIDRATVSWLTSVQAKLQISLDSDKPRVHDDIRRHIGAFRLALAALDLLQEHDIPVSVAFCATSRNVRDVEGVVGLAISRGIEVLAIGEVLPLYGSYRDQLALSENQYQQLVETVVRLRSTCSEDIDIQFASQWGFLYSVEVEHNPCTAMDRDVAVLHDGSVVPCPFVRHESYVMGNLLHCDLRGAWQCEAATRFRNQKHVGCEATCRYYAVCRGGCKAPLANAGMPIAVASPWCPLVRNNRWEAADGRAVLTC